MNGCPIRKGERLLIRFDSANRDDTKYLAHSMAYRTEGPPRIEYLPVRITRWQPQERTY